MTKKNSKLVAWRLSSEARALLSDVSKQTGLTKTQVVELCVAKHALEIPALADATKKALIDFMTRQLGQNQKKD